MAQLDDSAPAMTAPAAARYAVGIDLGTSHTVCAFAPLAQTTATASTTAPPEIALLPIAQRISAFEVQQHTLLPSVRYHGTAGEWGPQWSQPWPAQYASESAPALIGHWARELGVAVPTRLVASAKSWLSHSGVDRSAPILPWGAGDDVAKISPLQASSSYLAHLKTAWQAQHPDAPLAEQNIVLTVPASFDEGARALTLQAAHDAGLPQVQLLEEPKAAFHDWLVLQGHDVAAQLAHSRMVLVVDVGGGTTDLTLIRVEQGERGEPGKSDGINAALPRLTRCAVGEHLMLGGDNMDLALAYQLEPHFAGADAHLAPARFAQLVQRCRQAKEALLAQDAPEHLSVTLLGTGSRLLAQTRSVTLTRAQVQSWVVEGFFPLVPPQARPQRRQGAALRGLGLPYAQDAAITRHLAQFLAQHASESGASAADAWPDTVLLNGGVFHASALVERLSEQLSQWRGAAVRVLANPHPDWAVARGAAAHGWAQHQRNPVSTQAPSSVVPHIGGGAARSYWLVLASKSDAPPQGLCLLARGTEEGVRVLLRGRRFQLKLGQPVRFDVVARSSGTAQAGQIVPLTGEGWVELPPLVAALPAPQGRAQAYRQVQLQASLSEVGTLQVRCVSLHGSDSQGSEASERSEEPEQSWLLSFAVRSALGSASTTSTQTPTPNPKTGQVLEQIERIFGAQSQSVSPKEVRQLRTTLEKILGPREDWSLAVLRSLFDTLLERAKRRRRSPEHERVWLNLAGWCLRPGLGAQLDAWRMQQIWPLYAQGLAHPGEGANWTEWWVFWRRLAAGLDEAQQMQVLQDVADCMQKTVQRNARARWGNYDDMLRLFAAMEAVPWQHRQEMGQWMLTRLQRPEEPVHTWWAIGRLATRTPLAANAHLVMPAAPAQEFLQAALAQDWRKNDTAMFAAVQIARMTGDRALDLPASVREQVLSKLRASGAPPSWIEQVGQVQEQNAQDRQRSLGDSLPPGLVLI